MTKQFRRGFCIQEMVVAMGVLLQAPAVFAQQGPTTVQPRPAVIAQASNHVHIPKETCGTDAVTKKVEFEHQGSMLNDKQQLSPIPGLDICF